MLTNLLPAVLLFSALGAADVSLKPGAHLAFRGTVAQLNADHTPGEARKSFDLSLWVVESTDSSQRLYWLVDERGQGAWPWSERFGELNVAVGEPGQTDSSRGPALLYDYDEGQSVIPLASPLWHAGKSLAAGKPLATGAAWTAGGWKYEVQGEQKAEGREAWQIRVSNNYGAKRVLFVDKQLPLIVKSNERIFMNKGTEYDLETRLVATEQLPAERFQQVQATFAGLIALRGKLNRPLRTPDVQWSPAQMKLLTERLPELEKKAADGPLAKLLAAATRDVKLQSGRADEVAQLTAKYIGQTIGKFQMPGLSSAPAARDGAARGAETRDGLSDADVAGNVTVLHFWEYRDEPLVEPYGQVGYLEFLYQRRKEAGVRVVGVAVDGRLADEASRRAATTSIRKLKSFMNLSYPLVLDAGGFIKQLGDPRVVGAPLPLFVVVGRDGKISHYHVGFYAIDREHGLKELDAAVAAALEKKLEKK
jgi:Redoxin